MSSSWTHRRATSARADSDGDDRDTEPLLQRAPRGPKGPTAAEQMRRELEAQREFLRQQDDGLDIIDRQLKHLQTMSRAIDEEMDLHHDLLEEMDGEVSDTNRSVLAATLRVKRLLHVEDCGMTPMCIICVPVVLGHRDTCDRLNSS